MIGPMLSEAERLELSELVRELPDSYLACEVQQLCDDTTWEEAYA